MMCNEDEKTIIRFSIDFGRKIILFLLIYTKCCTFDVILQYILIILSKIGLR